MYLSKLTLNPEPGARQVHRDLASPYDLHRTILRAFPDADKGGPGRVLFRLEPLVPGEPPIVLVQSDKKPDWSALERVPDYLRAVQSKPFVPKFRSGQRLRFRLRANPTVKRDGKRHGLVKHEDQCRWLARKGESGGFRPLDFIVRRSSRVISPPARDRRPMVHLGVEYEGILEVIDTDQLTETIAVGVGPAKGLGFGLLSVAPLKV